MPWKKNSDGQEIYIPENKPGYVKLNEDTFFVSIQSQNLNNKLGKASTLSNYILSRMLEPIQVNVMDLKNEEEAHEYIISYNNKPFSEADRGGSMLSSFCFANGMEYEDLFILRDDPSNPRYQEINDRFENLRHSFYEMVCCDDETKRDKLVTDYYSKFIDRTEKAMEKLNQKDNLDYDDFVQFSILTDNFQSIGVQTLNLGRENSPGLRYLDLVNNELEKMGKKYDFDHFFNTSAITSLATQSSRKMANSLRDCKNDEVELDNETILNDFINPSKIIQFEYEQFQNFFEKDGKTINQKLADFSAEKNSAIIVEAQNVIDSEEVEQHLLFSCKADASKQIFKDVSDKHISTIFQAERKGLFGRSENSAEFKAIQDKLGEFAKQETLHENTANPEDLYNACKAYINAKSGNPSTSAGKDRLRAVSSLMAASATRMLENNPEKANEINEDFKAFSKKSKIFQSELKESNKANVEKLNNLSKKEVQNIKDTMKLGINADNKDRIMNSLGTMVVAELLKKADKTNLLEVYADPDLIQKKTDKLKPFIDDMIKTGDHAALNKALSGKNPAKDFADLFEKHYNNANRSAIVAEHETKQMQLDAMKL